MADNTKLLLIGGAGVAAWWFFFRDQSAAPVPVNGSLAPAGGGSAPPAGGTAPGPGAPAPAVTPAPVTSGSLIAAIEARVLAATGNPADGLGPDAWGWYLNNELAALGKPAAPDPLSVFGAGLDRSQKLTAAQYWPRMEAALRSQLGLSGFRGLGLYGMGIWGRAS